MNQDLKKTLWAAADKLRSSMDAAEYKHIVLGLIFLKYISDAFDERRETLKAAFADEFSDLHLPDAADHADSSEERDYYTMANVFWVPEQARWESIRALAKQADIGTRIDAALEAIEVDNPRLKGILDKRFGRSQLEPGKLGELVDLVSTIGFGAGDMVEADAVEVMVALPPQLFFNTQIPACLWFLSKDKSKNGRNRRGEVLFIDARKLGRMETRVTRVFDDEDIARVANTVHRWRADGEVSPEEAYADVPGFCRVVKLAEIAEHGFVLTPGRYVGAEEADDDDEAFDEKMERLTIAGLSEPGAAQHSN